MIYVIAGLLLVLVLASPEARELAASLVGGALSLVLGLAGLVGTIALVAAMALALGG